MRTRLLMIFGLAAAAGAIYASLPRAFAPPATFPAPTLADSTPATAPAASKLEVATFGSGCFWCTEAVFAQLKGVTAAESGYSGGAPDDATYAKVCSGTTGHAEVVQVTFDPAIISYAELLHVFWRSHDPTTLNRQGPDAGPQYRSAVFTHTDAQRREAERYKAEIDAAKVYPAPIVTEITPFEAFYPAEAYHQDFYAANPKQGYCRAVIAPKLEKLRAVFGDKLK